MYEEAFEPFGIW